MVRRHTDKGVQFEIGKRHRQNMHTIGDWCTAMGRRILSLSVLNTAKASALKDIPLLQWKDPCPSGSSLSSFLESSWEQSVPFPPEFHRSWSSSQENFFSLQAYSGQAKALPGYPFPTSLQLAAFAEHLERAYFVPERVADSQEGQFIKNWPSWQQPKHTNTLGISWPRITDAFSLSVFR